MFQVSIFIFTMAPRSKLMLSPKNGKHWKNDILRKLPKTPKAAVRFKLAI